MVQVSAPMAMSARMMIGRQMRRIAMLQWQAGYQSYTEARVWHPWNGSHRPRTSTDSRGIPPCRPEFDTERSRWA